MICRYRIEVNGVVQGVGFRPFVFSLAERLHLDGWVCNHSAGVSIEIQGEDTVCHDFVCSLSAEAPALAVIDAVSCREIPVEEESGFSIRESKGGGYDTLISPDMSVCEDCLADMRDPQNRRHRYAFTNCTNCGPRFTIIQRLPYDRPATTMSSFPMCPDCTREYGNPRDRRFHAQPNACPVCGPALSYLDKNGDAVPGDPFHLALSALHAGGILAIKGLGGYHLACNAKNSAAVTALRKRKYRWDKPFALMAANPDVIRRYAEVSREEEALLTSQRRPIVLLKKRLDGDALPEQLAPGNGRLGFMLPYTPLHYLLMDKSMADPSAPDVFDLLVMTSGNISDEPIHYEDETVSTRLSGIADGYLTHNRKIFRRCDDSVAFYAAGKERLIRRARGYAPFPVTLPDCKWNILACGAEQKNTFCLTRGEKAFLSQHIGDLDNHPTLSSYETEIEYFRDMFNSEPEIVAYDTHPGYLSTQYAREKYTEKLLLPVQHHHAHLASVLAENNFVDEAIGLIFDGTGYGTDGTLWGGEVLLGDCATWQRYAHLLPLRLPGGERAVREPWRIAMAALLQAEVCDEETLPHFLKREQWQVLLQAASAGINTPLSSGMGRLFDAAAAAVGIGLAVNYEGQAAVEFEQAMGESADTGSYVFDLLPAEGGILLDWRTVLRQEMADFLAGLPISHISRRFHNGIIRMCVEVCQKIREEKGMSAVALSGGCWQNLYLLEQAVSGLQNAGFQVLTNSLVPANDGGIAYGQAAVAAAMRRKGMI